MGGFFGGAPSMPSPPVYQKSQAEIDNEKRIADQAAEDKLRKEEEGRATSAGLRGYKSLLSGDYKGYTNLGAQV